MLRRLTSRSREDQVEKLDATVSDADNERCLNGYQHAQRFTRMATTTESVDDQLVKLGRSTLELLEKREEAARLAAAKLELQSILAEAESGNSERLKVWLQQNADVAKEVDTTGFSITNTTNVSQYRFDSGTQATANDLKPATDLLVLSTEDLESKLPATDEDHASVHDKISEDPWRQLASASMNRRERLPLEALSQSNEQIEPLAQGDSLFAKQGLANEVIRDGEPRIALATAKVLEKEQKPLPKVAFDVEQAMSNDPETKKRALKWLSGSVGVSLMIHIALTIALGLAVITISQPKEPISITSSAYEESATLDAPLEIEQVEQLEVTEVSSQVEIASATTAVDSQATTDVIAEVGVGPIAAPISNPLGSTLSQATSAMGSKGDLMGAAQFLGVGAAGNTFAFLVDNSGSIAADGVFEMVKIELMRAIRALKPTQRFFVAFFGDELQVMILDGAEPSDYPVYATPENISKLERWVPTVKIQKGKHPGEAIELAIEKDPDAIFLLFDGATTIDLLARVKRVNRVTDLISGERPKVPINTLRFPPSKADSADEPKFDAMMKKLAAENGGTYRYVPKPNRPTR